MSTNGRDRTKTCFFRKRSAAQSTLYIAHIHHRRNFRSQVYPPVGSLAQVAAQQKVGLHQIPYLVVTERLPERSIDTVVIHRLNIP